MFPITFDLSFRIRDIEKFRSIFHKYNKRDQMNYEEIEKTRKETQQPREIHIRIAIEIF